MKRVTGLVKCVNVIAMIKVTKNQQSKADKLLENLKKDTNCNHHVISYYAHKAINLYVDKFGEGI